MSLLKKVVTIALLLNCFLYTVTYAQHPGYQVTSFEESLGIQNSAINAILQDSKGFMWFGTTTGLYRYDGYDFKVFRKQKGERNTLPGNLIFNLSEDQDGKIWIGQPKEVISCFDPATGVFKNYRLQTGDTSGPASNVSMIFIDRANEVWVGLTQRGLFKLDKATGKCTGIDFLSVGLHRYTKELRQSYNNIYAMAEEGNHCYWLATHDGLYQYDSDEKEMKAIPSLPASANGVRNDLFGAILVDKDGLWLGSWAGGLSFYNIKKGTWENYKFNPLKSNIATTNIVTNIQAKSDEEIWVTSNDRGLGYFNKKTHLFTFLSETPQGAGIPAKLCFRIFIDKQENIWLSYEKGLMKIRENDSRFKFIPVSVKRTDNTEFYGISCMFEDREGRWLFIGTTMADGLHVTDKKTGSTQILDFEVKKEEENFFEVEGIVQDQHGIIWVLTRDFVYQFDQSTKKLEKILQPQDLANAGQSNLFSAIAVDKTDNIWLTTNRNGVFCYDPVANVYAHYFNDTTGPSKISSNIIKTVAVDQQDRVWIGGTRGCFGYIDKNKKGFINLDLYAHETTTHLDERIYSLFSDSKGNIYAGTDIGLFYYDASAKQPILSKTYDNESGLNADAIIHIAEDKSGDIWCSSTSAVCKIKKKGSNIINFGKRDGIPNMSAEKNFYLFASGELAIMSYGGYFIVNPASLSQQVRNAPLRITSLKIDDKETYFDDLLSAGKKLIVPPGTNIISFEYAALDFTRPDQQQYEYMLDGFDKEWVAAGQRRYSSYSNLPEGDYVFRVRSATTPGLWSTVGLPLRVESAFYKTWWFAITLLLSVSGLLFALYRYKLKKQQQILSLENKAQMLEKEKALVMYESLKQQLNPHFLFNSLTSLSSLIRFDQKLAGDFLDGLSKIYRYILKSRDNETVPLNEEIRFVQTFIKLQQTRFDKGLTVNISIGELYRHSRIAPVTLQNLIENAIKHNIIDEENPLTIDIFTEEGYIIVRNNLQKKNFVETSNKQGMNSMKSLYHYLTSKPIIVTEEKDYFTVKIPLL